MALSKEDKDRLDEITRCVVAPASVRLRKDILKILPRLKKEKELDSRDSLIMTGILEIFLVRKGITLSEESDLRVIFRLLDHYRAKI